MATGLYVFMIAWNEFLFALLFLVEDRDRWTVRLGLSQLAGGIEVPTTVLMAGSVVLTLPIVIIFFACERLHDRAASRWARRRADPRERPGCAGEHRLVTPFPAERFPTSASDPATGHSLNGPLASPQVVPPPRLSGAPVGFLAQT